MDRHKYNLLLADLSINIYDGDIPSDALLSEFEGLFEKENMVYYSLFMKQLEVIIPALVENKGVDETNNFIDGFIGAIDSKFGPINTDFFKAYMRTKAVQVNDKMAFSISELTSELEACLSFVPISNVFFEVEVNEWLIGLYLKEPVKSLSKIKETSDRLKVLNEEKAASRHLVAMGDFYG